MDKIISQKFAYTSLSNTESLRYVRTLLISSGLVIEEKDVYGINPLATSLVLDLISNKSRFLPPNIENEYESYWNSFTHGVFDVITPENKDKYVSFYPNLMKMS